MILVGIALHPSFLLAQCDPTEYQLILKLAQEDLENRNYQRSIERFLDARDVCPQNKQEVDEWIAEAFRRIEGEKINAEKATQLAQAQALAFQIDALPENLNDRALRILEAKWKEFEAIGESVPPAISQTLAKAFYRQFRTASTPAYLLPIEQISEHASNPVFSPDDQYIFTFNDGYPSPRLWNTQRKLLREFDVKDHFVLAATFSPDGQYIFTPYKDRNATLWDIQGTPLFEITQHKAPIQSFAFSPDGKLLLTGAADSTVKLWDLQGTLLADLRQMGPVDSLGFTINGQRIIAYYSQPNRRFAVPTIWSREGKHLQDWEPYIPINGISAVSPDGQSVVIASPGKDVTLWKIGESMPSYLNPKSHYVNRIMYSPEGKYILTYSTLWNTALLWNTEGQLLDSLQHQYSFLQDAIFSPDGNFLLTYDQQQRVLLWNMAGDKIANLNPERSLINQLLFSPDSRYVFINPRSGSNQLWNLAGELVAELGTLQELTTPYESFDPYLYSPTGRYIFKKQLLTPMWDLSGHLIVDIDQHGEIIWTADFSPDEEHILTQTVYGSARLWKFNGESEGDFSSSSNIFQHAYFSPDGHYILNTPTKFSAQLWNLQGDSQARFLHPRGKVNGAIFSPNGKQILTWSEDSTAKLWNLNGDLVMNFASHGDEVKRGYFAPDGKSLITTITQGDTRWWDTQGKLILSTKSPFPVFSPDGQRILTNNRGDSRSDSIQVWNIQGNLILNKFVKDGYVELYTYDPSGKYIVLSVDAGPSQYSLLLWDEQGNLVAKMESHSQRISHVAFSPDGQLLVTASDDGTAKLWNLTGDLLADMNQHTKPVNRTLFSPDGQRILTYSTDGSAKLWNLQGALLASFEQHSGIITSACFSANGKYILTSSRDGTAKLWPTPETIYDWLQSSDCPLRQLSITEREQYRLSMDEPITKP